VDIVGGPNAIVVTAGSQASNSMDLTVRPRIWSLTPNSGPIGTTVTIAGNAYGSSSVGNTVTFNGTPATAITSWTNTQIVVDVPVGNNDQIFTIGVVPTLLYLSPNNGNQTETLNVSIVGSNTNFVNGVTTANFGAGITVNYVTVIDSTHATANITITGSPGLRTVTITTIAEVITGVNAFMVNAAGTPMLLYVVPNNANIGDTLNVRIIGSNTSFTGAETVTFSNPNISVNSVLMVSATELAVNISIGGITTGPCNVTVGALTLINGFTVNTAGTPYLLSIVPSSADQGTTNLTVTVTGVNTTFVNGVTQLTFSGTGITVNWVNVTGLTSFTANIDVAAGATAGFRDVIVTTGAQIVSLANGFEVLSTPILWIDIDPFEGTEGIIYYDFGTSVPVYGYDTVIYHDGLQGQRVQYKWGNGGPGDWGGGWGGVLPAPLDISAMTSITFWLQGDGTTNTARFEIVEADGDVWASHDPTVQGLGYPLIGTSWELKTLPISSMILNAGQSTGNGLYEGIITNYNLIYTSYNQNILNANHYIDTIRAEAIDPPTQIIDLRITKVNANDARLDWSAATDDVAVLGYNIYESNSPSGPWTPLVMGLSPATLTFPLSGVVSDGNDHHYYVVADDGTSEGPMSNIASLLSTFFDTTFGNAFWISIPYYNSYNFARDIVDDLNGGPMPGFVTEISRFNPATQAYETLTWTGSFWSGTNFPIYDGEGFEIILNASTTFSIAGSHNPSFSFNLTNVGSHLISVPYNSTYATARSIVDSINVAAAPGTCVRIVRLNPATHEQETLAWVTSIQNWVGTDFAFVPGEGYMIVINGTTNWTPSVY
jgi:hypothetical protein